MSGFCVSPLPSIEFGAGSLARVPLLAERYGRRALIVTGGRSFRNGMYYEPLVSGLEAAGISFVEVQVTSEPSPMLVDGIVASFKDARIAVVVGIGGGSVLDAGKAIAGLLSHGNSVMDHLEGVGPELPYQGPATPYIAVPTTAGTGSEATKNAVLSVSGERGYKKSFRHDLLVPRHAVVDPVLLASCPPELVAANGMDALTQLLESLVSVRANPFSDALAWSGLRAVRDSLLPWFERGSAATDAHSKMAYAAMISGITLAQVGLGSVHGLAAPLGAFFPIPHGVACGTLVSQASRTNIRALSDRQPDSPALAKYAEAGRLLAGNKELEDEAARRTLVDVLEEWTDRMKLSGLGHYGMSEVDIPRVVKNSRGSSMKTNPIDLTDDEIADVLRARL